MVVALACRVVQGAVRACTGLCKGGRVAVARALVLAGDAALLQQIDVDVRAAHLVRLVYSTRVVARLAILWLYLLRLQSRWLSSLVRAWSNCISMNLPKRELLLLRLVLALPKASRSGLEASTCFAMRLVSPALLTAAR